MIGLVRLHEREDLPGIVPVSRANQAAAFFQDLSLLAKPTHFSTKLPQLLELRTLQPVLTTALVALGLTYPVADRRNGALELASQLPGHAARANQLNHLAPILRRVTQSSPQHPDTSSAQ